MVRVRVRLKVGVRLGYRLWASGRRVRARGRVLRWVRAHFGLCFWAGLPWGEVLHTFFKKEIFFCVCCSTGDGGRAVRLEVSRV